MNTSKLKNLVFSIIFAFAIAILFAGLKNYKAELSAFDLGIAVGVMFKALMKTVLYLGIITYLLKTIQIQNIAGLFFFLFIISITSSSIYSTTYNSSFEYGISVGTHLKQYLIEVSTIFLILIAFKPSALKQIGDKF